MLSHGQMTSKYWQNMSNLIHDCEIRGIFSEFKGWLMFYLGCSISCGQYSNTKDEIASDTSVISISFSFSIIFLVPDGHYAPGLKSYDLSHLLLTWFMFNPSMDN